MDTLSIKMYISPQAVIDAGREMYGEANLVLTEEFITTLNSAQKQELKQIIKDQSSEDKSHMRVVGGPVGEYFVEGSEQGCQCHVDGKWGTWQFDIEVADASFETLRQIIDTRIATREQHQADSRARQEKWLRDVEAAIGAKDRDALVQLKLIHCSPVRYSYEDGTETTRDVYAPTDRKKRLSPPLAVKLGAYLDQLNAALYEENLPLYEKERKEIEEQQRRQERLDEMCKRVMSTVADHVQELVDAYGTESQKERYGIDKLPEDELNKIILAVLRHRTGCRLEYRPDSGKVLGTWTEDVYKGYQRIINALVTFAHSLENNPVDYKGINIEPRVLPCDRLPGTDEDEDWPALYRISLNAVAEARNDTGPVDYVERTIFSMDVALEGGINGKEPA